LKLEEAVEQQLALENDNEFLSLNKEVSHGLSFFFLDLFPYMKIIDIVYQPATYDTAHFMQWAKEKFRKELAGRLTAKV
jgi:hypothetical protein